jgi:DNA-binding beta-propeller fold protein YncE
LALLAVLQRVQADLLYVWIGHDDGDHIATIDYTSGSPTFGTVLNRAFLTASANVVATGNEPHHIGMTSDYRYIVVGGLLSFLQGKDQLFRFTINPVTQFPTYSGSWTIPGLGCPDEFQRYSETELLVTMMCNSAGDSPGGIVKINVANLTYTRWDIGGSGLTGFNPHGFDYDQYGDMGLVVADFVKPASLFLDTNGEFHPVFRDTIRYFRADGTLRTTITMPTTGAGYMDIAFGSEQSWAVTAGSTINKLYIIKPFLSPPQVIQAIDFAAILTGGVNKLSASILRMTTDCRRMVMSLDMQYLMIISFPSDLSSATLEYTFDFCSPANGFSCPGDLPAPHYVTLSTDESKVFVTNYFARVGAVQIPGTGTIHAFDITSNRKVLNRRTTFAPDLRYNGKFSAPHGIAFSPLVRL